MKSSKNMHFESVNSKNDLKTELQPELSFLKRNISLLDRIIKQRIYGY